MAEARYAVINEADYASLTRTIPGLRERFSEWQFNRDVRIINWKGTGGTATTLVQVEVVKFKEWCERKGDAPSEHALDNYAFELADSES
jgi:hypothetical protein